MSRYTVKVICLVAGLFVGGPVGVYVHELGHQTACLHLGYESSGITFTLLESSHTCMFGGLMSGADVWLVQAAGGGIATVTFGATLVVFWLLVRMRCVTGLGDFLLYVILTGLVSQFINLVMEAGFVTLYNDETRALSITCASVMVCCVWYVRLPKRSSDHRWLNRIRRPST